MTHDLSMQLYSARNFPPLDRQIATLKEYGYKNAEPFRGLYGDVSGLKAALDSHGLTARSAHFSIDMLEKEFGKAVEIARMLGTEIVVLPYLVAEERPADGAGWAEFGQRVAALAAKVQGESLRLAWHNHDFEMLPLADGSRPIEHILGDDKAVEWEADAAWIVRADEDPIAWIERYSGRIAAVHVKDTAPAGENADEDGWADVGQGTMDWRAIWAASQKAGAELMIAEHDNPSDFARFARRSAEAIATFGNGH